MQSKNEGDIPKRGRVTSTYNACTKGLQSISIALNYNGELPSLFQFIVRVHGWNDVKG